MALDLTLCFRKRSGHLGPEGKRGVDFVLLLLKALQKVGLHLGLIKQNVPLIIL